MSSKQSHLSDPRCQCDFVVATTQASINSNLLEYLDEQTQPEQYVCFIQETRTGPTLQITLEEVMSRTGGINPFYIPENTNDSDERVKKLQEIHFQAGVMLQMGIPEGYTRGTLPDIVTLNTASNVTFNLFCKKAKVVSMQRDDWGVVWQVSEQPKGPSGDLWTMKMFVDLTTADLDKELDTPYFNNHPKVKNQLLGALKNISGTAFSLQQLLFDLDNAALQTAPEFSTVHDKHAKFILEEYWRDIYVKGAKEHGLPLVAVTAVSQPKDESTLHMTGFERIVNQLKDSSGGRITNPTESQQKVATLDHLCATNNNPIPRISDLDWNWVQPQDVDGSSGAIAINRTVLAKYIASQLMSSVSSACLTANIYSDHLTFSSNGTPNVTYPSTTANVIHMDYSQSSNGTQSSGLTELDLNVKMSYTLDVYFKETTIELVQHSQADISGTLPKLDGSFTLKILDKTLNERYGISVDQAGGLHLVKIDESSADNSETEPSLEWASDDCGEGVWDFIIEQLLDMFTRAMQNEFNEAWADNLHELQISQLQNFVFPGAKVFTYKDPSFSDHQDLVCKITYLDPNQVSSPTQDPKEEPQTPQEPRDHQTSADGPPPPPPPLPIQTATVGKLTASTALMQNYIQGEIVSPTGKFEALQTGDGHALVFAVDSGGVFHVIEEQSGTLHTGWQVHDLSTAAIQSQFPGSRAVVRTFDVGQSVVDGTIGLMMAVQLDGSDHLFFSLGNSNQDLSWITTSHWTMVPFDPVNEAARKITVRGAMFAETENRVQYLVVDIDRSSQETADPHIARYHIDSACTNGHYWVKHDVMIDLSAKNYQSAVGRMQGKPVDGIYNAGMSGGGGGAQLIYEPIINAYGDGPATPIRLELPDRAIPSAIATALSDAQDGSTDLYAIGGSTLYCFPADWEEDFSQPLALCTSDFLAGTDSLRAMTHDGMTTVWGRNQSNQVYYLSCPTSRFLTPEAWSPPLPILTEIEHMSPYVNRADGGNTIFTAGGGRLKRIIQGSASTARIWRANEIAIATPPQEPCTSIRSHTTTIHVKKVDGKSPIPKATVQLSSNTRTPVYINGLYYVLSPVLATLVSADATGTVTVVEATDSLQGAVLTVSLANTTLTVNPMDNIMARLGALDSADRLRGAQVPTDTVCGGIVESTGSKPLLDPSTKGEDVEAAAQTLGLLQDSYSIIQNPNRTATGTGTGTSVSGVFDGVSGVIQASMCRDAQPGTLATASMSHIGVTNFSVFDGWGDKIEHWADEAGEWAFGDLWEPMKNEAKALGRFVRDKVTGAWHLIVKIGGKIYKAAMKTWHEFVAAAEWVIKKVVKFFEDVWAWVEALFNWPDIRRTKEVTHNVVHLWMQHQVDQIPEIARSWNQSMDEFRNTVNQFAGITDFNPLGEDGSVLKKPAAEGGADPHEGQTSDSMFFINKYRENAHQLTIIGGNDSSPTTQGVEGLLDALVTAVAKEADVLGAVFDQLQQLIRDFDSLSLEDILKRLMGLLADTVLCSVQVVVDALLKVLHTVAQTLVSVLDTKIHIPIISDILNKVFHIPDLSFLDLFTWIIAMAYTVVYKVTHDKKAPFPAHDDTVSAMISASSWADLATLFGQPSNPESSSSFASLAARPSQLATSSAPPETYWFTHGHTLAAVVGIPLAGANMAESEGLETGVPGVILAILKGGLKGSANFISPRDPIDNKIVSWSSIGLIVIEIGCKVIFSGGLKSTLGFLDKKIKPINFGKLQITENNRIGAIVDAVLVLPNVVVTAWHVVELIPKPAGKVRSAAILDECSNMVTCIQRVSTAIALNDPEPDSKEIAVGLAGATTLISAGFQLAEASFC